MCRSVSGTDTAHTQRMVFTQGCLLSYMPSKKALLPRLLHSCLLLVCCSGQLHVHLVIIFWNHADQTDTGAAFLLSVTHIRKNMLPCCWSSFAVMYMHEKNGAFVVQDTSTCHVPFCLCVHPWNRYCTYTGSINEVQNRETGSPSLLLLCISRRNCCLVCCSGQLHLPVFYL